MITKHTKNIV